MPMTINTNTAALSRARSTSNLGNGLETTMQRLSSGVRVNAQESGITKQMGTNLLSQTASGSEGVVLYNLRRDSLAGGTNSLTLAAGTGAAQNLTTAVQETQNTNLTRANLATQSTGLTGKTQLSTGLRAQSLATASTRLNLVSGNAIGQDNMAATLARGDVAQTGALTSGTRIIKSLEELREEIRTQGIETYGEEFGELADKFGDDFLWAYDKSGDKFYQKFTLYSDVSTAVGNFSYNFFGSEGKSREQYLEDFSMKILNPLTKGVSEYGGNFLDALDEHGPTILNNFAKYGSDFMDKVFEYGETFIRGVDALGKDFIDLVGKVGKEAIDKLDDVIDVIKESTNEVGRVLKDMGEDLLDGLKKTGKGFVGFLSKVEQGVKAFVNLGTKVFQKIEDTLGGLVNSLFG